MKRVLIADDNEDLRVIFYKVLDNMSFDVYMAKDGEEAIQQILQVMPDIIILDIDMPKLSGLDVMDFLKTNHYPTKIILVTGNTNMLNMPQTTDADLLLVKPISIDELVTFVNRIS